MSDYEDPVETGRDFGMAVVRHLKLDDWSIGEVKMITTANEPLAVNVTVWLSSDDIKAIGDRMKEQS